MRRYAVLTGAVALVFVVAGCAGFRTEREGRDVGRAICDLESADDADESQRAIDKLNRHLDKALRITGRPVSEDVSDIQANILDLRQHVAENQDALADQDVAAIKRNLATVIDQAPALVKRFYEGVDQGLGDCT